MAKRHSIKGLLDRLENDFTAAAFAEAGEFDEARRIAGGRRAVVLALTGMPADRLSFKYALNLCRRIDASLEIVLLPEAEETLRALIPSLTEAAVDYRTTRAREPIHEAVLALASRLANVHCVVADSGPLDLHERGRKASKAWAKLGCPLVAVSEAEAAA